MARRAASVRTFGAFAAERGFAASDIAGRLRQPAVPAALPTVLDADQIDAAIRTRAPADAPAPADPDLVAVRLRDGALLEMIYATGVRVSEVTGLDIGDIDHERRVARVLGKGGKERMVPVHPAVLAPLAQRIKDSTSPWVFPSPLHDGHVGYDYVYKRMKAALGGAYTPHQLRHRFATQAYRGTKDLRAVQELLGHSSPNTTVRYTLIEDDALAAAVASVA